MRMMNDFCPKNEVITILKGFALRIIYSFSSTIDYNVTILCE